jgi:hypothetical protein
MEVEKQIPIVVSDYPTLAYREKLVSLTSATALRSIFLQKIKNQSNPLFDVTLSHPDLFLKPKINYVTEVLKQSCQVGKSIAFVCEMG